MNLIFRLIWVKLTSLFVKPKSIFEEFSLRLMVFPNDLDPYGHMNNGRYLTLMDLGRYQLIEQSSLKYACKKSGWLPLVASSHIRYRKSLRVGNVFILSTKIVSMAGPWIYIQQRFERGGKVYADAFVKGVLITAKTRQKVDAKLILSQCGHEDRDINVGKMDAERQRHIEALDLLSKQALSDT